MSVEKLVGGVTRFRKHIYPGRQDFFEQLALGQTPETLFITCADSRIDPCLLTQTHPGDLFICRVIGNIVPPYPDKVGGVSATVEYAVGVLRVRSVIVCGHTDCGVMKGAVNPQSVAAFPNVAAWLEYAEIRFREPGSEPDILAHTEHNITAQLRNLRTHPAVADRLAEGNLTLYGWLYDLAAGTVTAYNEESDRFEPIASVVSA
jgi:carbonic anhydrase